MAHFKDTDPKTGHETWEYFLEQPAEASDESYLQQLSPFVHVKDTDREKGSVNKKDRTLLASSTPAGSYTVFIQTLQID